MTSESKDLASTEENLAKASSDRFWQAQRDNLQVLVIALGLALFIRFFIAEPRFIPSDSMLPTLYIGDRLAVEKVSYYFRPPQTGDIVVFQPPQPLQALGFTPNQALIKRVIGQPGQTIKIQAGTVYLNNQPLKEGYIAAPPNYRMEAVTVPENTVFVMGDNRNNSNDSHVWGFLPRKNIIGRAVFRFFPIDRIGLVR